MAFDLIIEGAEIVDGTGAPPRIGDVGVQHDRVAAIGNLKGADAKRRINAGGLTLTPGFIDVHVHLDTYLLTEPDASPLLAQGVTTAILGQDGLGLAPTTPESLRYVNEYMHPVNPEWPIPPQIERDGLTVEAYLALLDRSCSVNVAYLVPHGIIRHNVLGLSERPPSPDELQEMRSQVRRGMEQGAIGLSTGLEYVPGMHADTAELVALAREVAAFDGVYVTHMRSYVRTPDTSVGEVAQIARDAGLRAHISHFNLKAEQGISLIDAHTAAGADLSIETYPYLAGNTILSYFLPGWAVIGGVDETTARLSDPQVRRRLRHELSEFDWSRVQLSSVPDPDLKALEGERVDAVAARSGLDAIDFVCDLLVKTRLATSVVQFHTYRTEEDVRALMRHPRQTFGSDGIYRGGRPHPRGWGCFARVLARYVREEPVLSLSDAIRRMTSYPAARMGLRDRGLIREGAAADLVLLDPAQIVDLADYTSSRRPAEGVRLVTVNGAVVWEDGRATGVRSGRALTL